MIQTLNDWLCQHFDRTNKGYVTIRDAVELCFSSFFMLFILALKHCSIVLAAAVVLIGFYMYLYGGYLLFFNDGFTVLMHPFQSGNIWRVSSIGFFSLLSIPLVPILLYSIFSVVLNTRIATCKAADDADRERINE